MDKELLVKQGHRILQLLDGTVVKPQFAMWVFNTEPDSWKLWIMPSGSFLKSEDAYRAFYRNVSDQTLAHQDELFGLDAGSIVMVDEKNPVLSSMKQSFRMPNLGSAYLGNNNFNGYYMLDGILLLSNFESKAA